MASSDLIRRYLKPRVEAALGDTPVVLVNGPRQAGKTTLVRQFAGKKRAYVTLDDPATLAVARDDPAGFVRALDSAVIDEVQRVPELLLSIKLSVDQDRRPGRFLLTGSANVMTLPRVADSLAGRIEILPLLPLAGCELQASRGRWLDAIFAGLRRDKPPRLPPAEAQSHVGDALVHRVLRGGYPQALTRTTARRREAWTRQYLDTLIQRDVRDIATVDKMGHLPRLLAALAQMSGQLCNIAQLAGQIGLDNKTAEKYLWVFERMFLLDRVPQWSGNALSRILKSPKLQFIDSGLLCSVLGLNESLVLRQRQRFGPALESHVYGELLKLASWAESDYLVSTFRTATQAEVDFVVEERGGDLIGIEVKAAASFGTSDLAGLKKLAEAAGDRFVGGVLLYDGVNTLPAGKVDGKPLWALPLSNLWLT
jgi:predicted AAA+ superfamily ATPase